MARIRSAKPELLEDEKAGPLPHDAWRLWVSSWLLADDYGNFRADPSLVHGRVFWAHPEADTPALLRILGERGFLQFYGVRGQRYAHIRTWDEHQKVDHPGKPLCPGPELADNESVGGSNQDVGGKRSADSVGQIRETLARQSRLTGTGTGTGTGIRDRDPPLPPETGGGSFEADFWLPYPRKVGKAAAKRAWDRIRPKPTTSALQSALAWQTQSEQWRRGFVPNPVTYLNQRRWEDEKPVSDPPRGGRENGTARDREERNAIAAERWLAMSGSGVGNAGR